MNNTAIVSTGSYLPAQSVTNFALEQKIDTTHEWIYSRTGITSRHIAQAHETTSFMAAQAGQSALSAAQLDPDMIDLVLVATCTPDFFFPSTACYVKHELGIKRSIPALDISAACSGFIYGLDIAKQYIATGQAKYILLIGSEKMSTAIDWGDRTTCVLFGDGAGAVILQSTDKVEGLIVSKIYSDYDADSILTYANCPDKWQANLLKMQGNTVFKSAVNLMGQVVEDVLAATRYNVVDIDWLIPHQANIRIMQSIAKKLNMPMSKVIVTVDTQGNTSAASIPIALDTAIVSNKIHRDDLLFLEAFGGGMTWGGALLRY